MAQFADHDDLATRLGVTLTSDEEARADTLLSWVSALIQAEARQVIEQVIDDVLTRTGSYDDTIRLPQRPITDVSSVVLNGVTLTAGTDYIVVGDLLMRPDTPIRTDADFEIAFPSNGWGDPSQPLVVTYTHGFETIPEEIVAVCCEPVRRVWVNPGGVIRENFGPESTQYLPTTRAAAAGVSESEGLLLNQTEKDLIRYVLNQLAGTTRLR